MKFNNLTVRCGSTTATRQTSVWGRKLTMQLNFKRKTL